MVNKKKKNRQQGPDEQNASDSTESCDESLTGSIGGKCPHVAKALDFTRLKKSLKSSGIARECMDCSRTATVEPENTDAKPLVAPGLWLCLQCGHQSCGRDRLQHALKHHKTPRSDLHCLVVNTELWNVWCYECAVEVPPTCKKTLHGCLEFVKRQEDAPVKEKKTASNTMTRSLDSAGKTVSNAIVGLPSPGKGGAALLPKDLPRVRGLRNNGNTCFFNAVLQCLAHTPFLVPVLREMSEAGEKFHLPGTTAGNGETNEGVKAMGEVQMNGDDGFITNKEDEAMSEEKEVDEDAGKTNAEVMGGNEGEVQVNGGDSLITNKEDVAMCEEKEVDEGTVKTNAEVKAIDVVKINGGYGLITNEEDKARAKEIDEDGVKTEKGDEMKVVNEDGVCQKGEGKHERLDNAEQNDEDCSKESQEETNDDVPMVDKEEPMSNEEGEINQEDKLESGVAGVKEEDESLPPMEGELPKWGILTEALVDALTELQSSNADVYNPAGLMRTLTKRCPLFEGSDQHDSQELLRHLLEGVRTEDLKRYQMSILRRLGLSEKVNPNDVDGSLRCRAKVYGRQAAELSLRPDQVFRGSLVSTLECQDCRHASQRTETFLDLSLPVMVDKPQPPMVLRRKSSEDASDICGSQPSKHQQKKEKKMARKGKKRQGAGPGGKGRSSQEGAEPTIDEENAAESEQSDADVEDNLDLDAAPRKRTKDVGESGYSSEKLANEDSPTESSPMLHGDSALASPVDARRTLFDLASPGQEDSQLPSANDSIRLNLPDELPVSVPVTSLWGYRSESPLSSDVNLEVSDRTSRCQAAEESERPVSRFAFNTDERPLRCSPTSDVDLEVGLRTLALDTCDLVADVSEEEVNHLLKELSEEKLDSVGPRNEDTSVLGNGDGPLQEDKQSGGKTKAEVNAKGDVSLSPLRERRPSLSWSTTLSPKCTTDDGECSIMSCLNQFTAVELMTGNNRVGCEACTQRQNHGKEGKMVTTNSTKQFLISSPPPVLILHLKRFQLQRSLLKKMARHVSFPRILDLAPLISTKSKDSSTVSSCQRQVLYSLYGIVEHSGTLQYGHYIAYVKVRAPLASDDPRWRFLRPRSDVKPDESEVKPDEVTPQAPPGKWYCVSDARVNEVSEDKVMRSEAYLLFYERIW